MPRTLQTNKCLGWVQRPAGRYANNFLFNSDYIRWDIPLHLSNFMLSTAPLPSDWYRAKIHSKWCSRKLPAVDTKPCNFGSVKAHSLVPSADSCILAHAYRYRNNKLTLDRWEPMTASARIMSSLSLSRCHVLSINLGIEINKMFLQLKSFRDYLRITKSQFCFWVDYIEPIELKLPWFSYQHD